MNNKDNSESEIKDAKSGSEQKRTLMEPDELFRQIGDTAPVMIWISGLDKKCFWFNKPWLDFTGRAMEEEIGDGWTKGVHPDDLDRCLEIYTSAFDERSDFSMEYRLRRRDGEYRWIVDNGVPRFSSEGEFLGFIGSCFDITERKEAETARIASDAQRAIAEAKTELMKLTRQIEQQAVIYNTTLSTITDYVYRLDREGRFIYANQALLDLWGIEKLDPSGISMPELDYPKEVEAKVLEGVRRVFETKRTVKDQTAYTSPTGAVEFHEFIFNPVFDENGEVDFIIGSSRDISEHKKLENELKETDRRKDEFLATLAHELRNPLAPIRSGLEVIGRFHDAVPAAVKNTLGIIERQTNQIVRLVDDLIDISRITQGKINLRKERIELETAIDMAVESCRDALESNGHKFILETPGTPVYIEADLTRVSQIILNVLNNAAKYTPPGGEITLKASAENGDAVIVISDTGIGIPKEMLPRVFDLFAQLETAAEQARSGLGIGMSVAKQLTEMHGGTIAVASDGEGKGSRFRITFPLAEEQSPENNIAKEQSPQPIETKIICEKKRILVVDDNADAAEMLQILLELEGYSLRTVFSAEEALEIVDEFQPAACLCDIGLPEMNGYELAKRLRRMMPDVLLISISGWGQQEDRRRSKEAGFDHHLVKPVSFDALIPLVKKIDDNPAG